MSVQLWFDIRKGQGIFLSLYSFFRAIPWRLYFTCRRFGTHCSILIGRVNKNKFLLVHLRVSKRRHVKFRRRGITRKKQYIYNTAKAGNQDFFFFSVRPERAIASTQPPSEWVLRDFLWGLKLTIQLQLAPRLRICGCVPSPFSYVFMARPQTYLLAAYLIRSN